MTGRRTTPTITLAKRLPRDSKKAFDAAVKAGEDSCAVWIERAIVKAPVGKS